jgi:hypothetical protein
LHEQYRPRDPDTDSRNPTVDEMAALLFADSRVGSQYMPRRSSLTSLMSASGFTTAARGTDDRSRVYRAIAVAWLNSRDEPREMYQCLSIARTLDLPDQACTLAARLLVMPGVTASYRGRAASHLAAYGDKRHLALLRKAANQTLVVYTVRITPLVEGAEELLYEVQLRDLVLAVSLLMTGQKLEDYGFADRYGGSASDRNSFTYSRYYFTTDTARKAAFAKWEKWQQANPDG